MSETPETSAPATAPAAQPAADPMPEVPALSAERLPPNYRKHVDPASPAPMRGMAAKGLVPFNPSDLCHSLAMLAGDADAKVAESARKTASTLPDRIWGAALRDESLNARVLDFFADQLAGNAAALEAIVLNPTAHDQTVAHIAGRSESAALLEIIAGNQLRLLRSEALLRALVGNPKCSPALVDSTCDFAVRNGVMLLDVPAMVASYERIHGHPPAPPESPEALATAQNSAAAVMEDFGGDVTDPEAPPLDEGTKLNLTQRVMRMTVSEKIKLATLGNKEARGILLRDPNKLVLLAVIHSPRITDGEVLMLSSSKTCQDDVLRSIYQSREWTRSYQIRLSLVKNPKVPAGIAMRFMNTLRDSEIKDLAFDKNVPSTVRLQAKKMISRKQ